MAWGEYVPLAVRQARGRRELEKLRKKGLHVQPVELQGRTIARSFWGKGWCEHLESFADFANRLERGRAYVRNGSVCHLEIRQGVVEARVSGSSLYHVRIQVEPLPAKDWQALKQGCAGEIASMLELLQGKFSQHVMARVADRQHGLFPRPKEIKLACSCPDFATMCKHVAATLYGVGNRLDHAPELLFLLRGVDPLDLLGTTLALPSASGDVLPDHELADIFGIELDLGTPPGPTDWTAADVLRLRQHFGLGPADFARHSGLSLATVLRWESSQGPLQLRAKTRGILEGLKAQAGL